MTEGEHMNIKSMTVIGATLIIAAISPTASASYIEGTFAGVAHGVQHRGPSEIAFSEPVSGSFSFSVPGAGSGDCCGPVTQDSPTSAFYDVYVDGFPVDVFGNTYVFGDELQLPDYGVPRVVLTDDGDQQQILVDRGGPYHYWQLSLIDADRQLFHDFDPTTVDFSQLDLGLSALTFSTDIRDYYLTLPAAQIQFTVDGVPLSNSVPEPGTLALFGAGLLSLVATRRRRSASR